MEIITPRKIPEPNMSDYSKKREVIFKEFKTYLKGKGLLNKFQRAEISIDFEIDPLNHSVNINTDRFAIYRVDKDLKKVVEHDLIRLLLKVKQQVDS